MTPQLAMGAIGALGKIGMGVWQNRMANKIKPVRTDYHVSPYAQNTLGMAQQMFNSDMPGASQMQQNIFANQANTIANVNRNAGNSSQALAMAAAAQGQTDQSLSNLGTQRGIYKMNALGNLNQANTLMIQEGDKVYKDRMMKYQEDMEAKNALKQAAMGNFGGAMSDITGMAMYGGKAGMFGKKWMDSPIGGTGVTGGKQ